MNGFLLNLVFSIRTKTYWPRFDPEWTTYTTASDEDKHFSVNTELLERIFQIKAVATSEMNTFMIYK